VYDRAVHTFDPRPAAAPSLVRDPARIPLPVLRDFVRAQARTHGIRAVAACWGVGYETLRKFVTGRTARPHPRQRELYGARFLEHHPAGYLAEPPPERGAPLRQLRMLLPPGRGRAAAVLERIFALAAAQPGAPPQTGAVGAWMRRLLEAEYDADGALRRPSAGP
jgi:hypothetical protein